MTTSERVPTRDGAGPIVRLLSFHVPVRSQSEFLEEFERICAGMAGARGYLGHETFLGGRNPRHVLVLTAWSSKRQCETFFEEAQALARRRRLVFRYLARSEFFRAHEAPASLALAGLAAARG
jgi:heme-degrading monooxygenase HmoA